MSMGLIFRQLMIIFGYVAIGVGAGKTGLINPEQRKYLTKICSSLLLPFTILSAASMEAGRTELFRFAVAFLVMTVLLVLTTAASIGINKALKQSDKVTAILTSLMTYPNCTFLGLPLCTALFGPIAILYSAACIVAFNLLFFTVQISLFTKEKVRLRAIFSIPTICTIVLLIMLALGLHWPEPVQTVFGNVGGMITPLSLIIIGVMLTESNLSEIFREKRAYVVTLFRNFIIPVIAMLLLKLAPLDFDTRLCMLVYLACPCATLTIIYSIQTDSEPELGARAVLFSTLMFAVSLPIVIALGQMVF